MSTLDLFIFRAITLIAIVWFVVAVTLHVRESHPAEKGEK